MAEIVVAAAEADAARASAIAEALAALGYDVTAQAAPPGDLAKTVEEAKCVVALWSSREPPASWLAAQAMLALDRKKLVCAEVAAGATPAPFEAAPRSNLDARDRVVFKQRFEALLAQIQTMAPAPGDSAAMPAALAKARAAVGRRATRAPRGPRWGLWAAVGATMVVLFGVGVGASRIMSAVNSGAWLLPKAAEATPTRLVLQPGYGLTERELETLPWRDAAARIGAADAERIKADAANGVAFAQALACLGHMAGAPGFLPSPTAASGFCDSASAQNDRAALYLSWTLQRTMPNAAISASVARARLQQAAQLGLTPAQVDYALAIAPDAHAPLDAQTDAGRMLLAAAEHGDARGQYYYARWLRDSPAGPRDPAAAVRFLQRAAAAGEPEALHLLATFYRDGIGVPRDAAKARDLYGRAAAENYAPAMFNLADLVRDDDRARAIALYGQLACMRDEHEISAMAQRRLRAIGQVAHCG
jgi:hypothetical protein